MDEVKNKRKDHKSKILVAPMHIRPFRSGIQMCIDEEIVSEIQALWDNDIITLSCCQGYDHMEHPYDKKNIVIHEGYDKDDIYKIKEIVGDDVMILQWKHNLEIV